jgi:hypothetical protein
VLGKRLKKQAEGSCQEPEKQAKFGNLATLEHKCPVPRQSGFERTTSRKGGTEKSAKFSLYFHFKH